MDEITKTAVKPAINIPKDRIHVKVHAPFRIYFDGLADSISAVNDTGPFDVLSRHHNFITLLSPCVIEVRDGESSKKIQISRGIMHVKQNDVTVFLDV